jgi:Icc-related predicted phosphoesterase
VESLHASGSDERPARPPPRGAGLRSPAHRRRRLPHGEPRADFQSDWLRHRFVPWLRRTPARQRVFIAGNHDFVFADEPSLVAYIDWPGIYLQDSGCVWEGVNIWGSPWTNFLPGWVFTAREEELDCYWDLIPDDTQVLLVHGPPQGIGDEVIGNLSGDVLHVGSLTLMDALTRLSKLKLVVFGHIHECSGLYRMGKMTLVNAALMDVGYYPVNPPRVLEMTF